jgi:glutathione S-transferase
MKLYFSPGACSLSPHIALREAGLSFDLERVDLKTKKTASGADYRAINPKGYVPTLELAPGRVLTEGPAIVQYIADQKPEARLAPRSGSFERSQLQEWLNFISTELHKGFSPLFNPRLPDDWRQVVLENLGRRFEHLATQLSDRPFVLGENFTVADGYAYVILRWAPGVKIDLDRWPDLVSYRDRIASRPAVRAALQAEGLEAR